MWSLVQRANFLISAKCASASCPETNLKGRKPMIELNERGTEAFCNSCGYSWDPHLPRPVAIQGV
jgi:hypothetical protein